MLLTVADIMEPVVPTVTPEDTLEHVLRTMQEHDLSGIPVVNSGGRCVGIITEEDLVMGGENSDLHLPHYFELFGGFVFLEPLRHFEERLRKAVGSNVGDIMTSELTTIEPDAGVHDAGRVIAESGHNRLPVIEHGRLVGVVTRVDVLEALAAAPEE